jgi:hypothetical protein
MDTNTLIREISAEDADFERFTALAIQDRGVRDEIVRQMLNHPHIMVYYHCYTVLDRASTERPDLFYAIAPLLHHANSYHRDIALTLIANLTRADVENRFDNLCDEYLAHFYDEKFMTGQCCVRHAGIILRSKPELRGAILARLLHIDAGNPYPERQQALMKADVLEILDEIYADVCPNAEIEAFICSAVQSSSPKTRKKSKELIRKYAIPEGK